MILRSDLREMKLILRDGKEAFVMQTDRLHRLRLVTSLPAKRRFGGLRQTCRRVALGLAVFSLVLVLLGPAWAADGDLDPSFNPGAGADGVPILWTQVYYNDGLGKTLIAGAFTEVGGFTTRGIARLNADGTPDDSFTSPLISGWVNNCLLLNPADATSKILIAGPFEIPSTKGPYYGLARLNANGTVDTDFPRTFGPCPGMSGFGVQSDGKIIVGGYALALNDYPGTTYYLLRLQADGTVDDDFPKRSAPGGFVRSVQAYPNTDPTYANLVRLLGCFPRLSDPTRLDYMLLLSTNGTTELARLGSEIVNGTILQMGIQGDGKMVIVGNFDQVYTTPMKGVARLLPFPTVGLDPDFNQFTSGANGFVQRVWLDGGNKPVIAGNFTSINGTDRGYFARLNLNGSVDTTFNPGNIGANDRIWTMFKRGDGTWMIYGAFQAVNGSTRQCMANLSSTGALNPQYASFSIANTGSSPTVQAIQDSPQGLYVGGSFSGFGGKYHGRMARVNFNGNVDPSLISQMDAIVRSIRTQEDGKVLVAGNFGNVTAYTPRTGLARFNLDGTLDRSFFPRVVKADGSMPDLYMVDTAGDGKILIAGDFAKIADVNHVMQPRTAFARLNADGTLDPTFNSQITIPGGSNIRVTSGGQVDGLYPMAGYVLFQGSPRGFFTRLTSTGALDLNFAPSAPVPHVNLFDGEVRCGIDTPDGRILVGGDFTHIYDGQGFSIERRYIAGFTATGLLNNTPGANPEANNPIHVMERQWPYSKILIGGAFTSYNGVVRNHIARINPDGSLDNSFDPGIGADGPVYAIAWNSHIRKARIGGAFSSYQGVSRPRIAQIFASAPSFDPGVFLLLMN
jgi:uncharacterized delta-60 repeat protein